MDTSTVTFTIPNIISMTSYMVGGLLVFLLGMKYMSDGVQAIAGERLSRMIAMVTDNPLAACGTGIFVTSLIQSSSVTTVMMVGLVNAGVMTLSQSIGVILGADIGTTITAWIVAIKVTKYGLLLLGISGFFYLFTKNEHNRFIAMLIMGLGMVFFGLQLMANGVEPLRHHADFIALLSRFSPTDYFGVIKCVIIGSIVTATIQSSSATVAITITLARTGVIDFDTSVALVLGQNIGTTITAFLGSLGMNINARRVAYAHILIKIFAVFLIIPFFFLYMSFLKWIINKNVDIATQIALAHTIFNVILVVAFLPFTRIISRLLFHVFKAKVTDSKAPTLTNLDIRMLDTPMISIEQSRKEILQMGQIVGVMLISIRTVLKEESTDKTRISTLFNQEEQLDTMQKEVVVFLTHLLTLEISSTASKELHEQLRRADEYESISDYAISILKIYLRLRNAGLSLDEEEKNDVLSLHDSVYEFYQTVYESHRKKDIAILPKARPQGEAITFQFREIRSRHLKKLSEKKLDPLICTLYPDLLAGYRRIKEHLLNIAEAVAGEK